MISIQVSVQQHASMNSLPSLIQAHIKLGRNECLTPSSSVPTMTNMPLTDYLAAEPMGKLRSHVDPIIPMLLEQRLLAMNCLKRSCLDNDDLLLPPTKKARVLDFPLLSVLPRPTLPTKAKKSVQFEDEDFQEIIPRGDEYEYDCDARWYSRDEYNSFRQDMKMNFFMHSMYKRRNSLPRTSKDMAACRPPKDLCIRGLEKFCFYSNHEGVVKDTRKLRMQAVLDQQCIQKALGNVDPMAIRVVAECHSQRVCEIARERAADDYRAVLYGRSQKRKSLP